jgi:4-amino-4-deoxy-L-arabinose transferase-like glycosyltransferase
LKLSGARSLFLPALVFALAALVRTTYVLNVEPTVSLENDAGYYDFFARSIARGAGYVTPDGHPTAFWPVGYPAFLGGLYWVFGESVGVARAANVVLDSLTAALIVVIGRRWWPDRLAGVAGGIYAFFPGAIGFTALTLSEPLFTFLLTAALAVLVHRGANDRWIASAVAFGVLTAAATYVRGLALLLPLLAGAWLFLAGGRSAHAVRFAATALAVVVLLSLPWAVRNTVRLGELTYLSTNFGQDLRTGHNPNATGGLDFHEQVAWAFQFTDRPPVEAELAKNRQGVREGIRYAVTHPLREIELSVRKVVRLYSDDADSLRWAEQYGASPLLGEAARSRLFLLFNAYYYFVGVVAVIGLASGLRARAPWALLGALVVIYWTVVHVAFFAEPRFHAPLLPLIALLAAGVRASGKKIR